MREEVRAACVIGWPVEHSRSPLIHRYWLEHYAISGTYRREAVKPEDFSAFLESLAAHGYCGANVTLPHKEAALALSQPDARARAVGAANTLWFEDGTLRSTNSDVDGFLANLDEVAPGWAGQAEPAVVVGAGGAARAVLHGLRERGVARIRLVNRSPDRARDLAARFGDGVDARPLSEIDDALDGAGLLVNASTLGMRGQTDLDWDLGGLRPEAVVADLVYMPLETALLAAAARRSLRRADGLGMLLHQAVTGFERWFGRRPEVTAALRALVERDLAAESDQDARRKEASGR